MPFPSGAIQRQGRTNLGTPNRFMTTPQFGTITQATTPNREIQASLRVSF